MARLNWDRVRFLGRSKLCVKDELDLDDNDMAAQWLKEELKKRRQTKFKSRSKRRRRLKQCKHGE